MFVPNTKCRIELHSDQTDVYGQPLPGERITEGCSIARLALTNAKSSVRADSSASRGTAMEAEIAGTILLGPRTRADIDDIVELQGFKLRIMGMEPRFDAQSRLDHYQAQLAIWSRT